MPFIGIVTNRSNKEIFEEEIKKRLNQNLEVIFIDNDNIDNLRNVTFSIILLCYDYKVVFEDVELLRKIVSNSKKFIVNTDIKSNYDILDSLNIDVVTYGFNSKASINASSTEEDVILCVQRNIISIEDAIIEPQEIKIDDNYNMINIYEKLGISIILLLYSKK